MMLLLSIKESPGYPEYPSGKDAKPADTLFISMPDVNLFSIILFLAGSLFFSRFFSFLMNSLFFAALRSFPAYVLFLRL
jgi:hypothetical protein